MAVRARASSVIVHRVAAADREAFLAWEGTVAEAASKFPGYQDIDLYPPDDDGEAAVSQWVVVVHFDDEATLAAWMRSPARAAQIAKYGELAERPDFEVKSMPGGFGPYFTKTAPPPWKMMLTVLLALYPTVVLLTKLVGPATTPLGFAVSVLVGNAVSVVLLDRAVMPLVTRALRPWLDAKHVGLAGLAVVIAAIGALTLTFRALWG